MSYDKVSPLARFALQFDKFAEVNTETPVRKVLVLTPTSPFFFFEAHIILQSAAGARAITERHFKGADLLALLLDSIGFKL